MGERPGRHRRSKSSFAIGLMSASYVSAAIVQIALHEFGDIVAETEVMAWSQLRARVVRIRFTDLSFLDVRLTNRGDYSYHWEHRMVDGGLHRWDNAPHHPTIGTYPNHLHEGTEDQIVSSPLPFASVEESARHVLTYLAPTVRANANRA